MSRGLGDVYKRQLFAIAIAAAETAIAISIIINIYREVGNSDVASVKQMRF